MVTTLVEVSSFLIRKILPLLLATAGKVIVILPLLASTRTTSFLSDFFLLVIISGMVGLAWCYFENKDMVTYLFDSSSPHRQLGWIFFLGNSITSFALLYLIFPWLTYPFWGHSIGAESAGATLRDIEQRRPAKFGEYLTRHFLQLVTSPLALLGFLPMFLGGKSLTDHLSGTTLCEAQLDISS